MAMAQTQVQTLPTPIIDVSIPPSSISLPNDPNSRMRSRLALDTYSSPVNQNGSFEFDRVVKSGYLQKRTQKTKVCPNATATRYATPLTVSLGLEVNLPCPASYLTLHLQIR